jgi:hypothetical protein
MSLIFIDLAYLALKGTISTSYQLIKGGYNLYAYASGGQYWEESDSDKDSLLKEISSLRSEIGELKNQIQHINEDTFYLVDPNQLPNTDTNADADKDADTCIDRREMTIDVP